MVPGDIVLAVIAEGIAAGQTEEAEATPSHGVNNEGAGMGLTSCCCSPSG